MRAWKAAFSSPIRVLVPEDPDMMFFCASRRLPIIFLSSSMRACLTSAASCRS